MTESEIAIQRSNQTAKFQKRIAELEKQVELLLWNDGIRGKQILEFGEEINKRGARINELEAAQDALRNAPTAPTFYDGFEYGEY